MVGLQEFTFEDHLPLGLPGRAYKSGAPCSRMYAQLGEPSNRGVRSPMKSRVAFLCITISQFDCSVLGRGPLRVECRVLHALVFMIPLFSLFGLYGTASHNCIFVRLHVKLHSRAPACQIAFSCACMSNRSFARLHVVIFTVPFSRRTLSALTLVIISHIRLASSCDASDDIPG